jgi:prevent-host-death family protein
MQTIGSYEAKTHLPRLLHDVAQGETIVITKHGKPIAKLVPYTEGRPRDKRAVVDALREYQRTAPALDGITTRELINEGRRR